VYFVFLSFFLNHIFIVSGQHQKLRKNIPKKKKKKKGEGRSTIIISRPIDFDNTKIMEKKQYLRINLQP